MKATKGKWKVENRKTCKVCDGPLPTNRHRTYCSDKCRSSFHNKKWYAKRGGAVYQREYLYKKRLNDGTEKVQCLICGKWYRQVGSHIWLVHKMMARDYREQYGFDVKRGQLPEDYRQLKAEYVFENGTVENLKKGKKYWFKKGQEGIGAYKRSEQTMARLKMGTKALKELKETHVR